MPTGYDEFVLVPCGIRLYVTYHRKTTTTGIIGNRYLLLQHPVDKEAALALIDDDPKYMALVMGSVDEERAAEISERVNAFRKTNPLIPQSV